MTTARRKTKGATSVPRGQPRAVDRRLLVVGAAKKSASMRRALSRLDVRVEQMAWERCLAEVQRGGVLAVALVASPSELSLREAVQRLTEGPPAGGVPTVVLVDVAETGRSARALYRAGATAVLRWPRRPAELAAVLAETLGIARVRGPARRVDAALARTVRAHLRLFGGTTPGLRVSISEGVVHLGGSVPSLERKQEVTRVVSGVAGVTATDATALHVIPNPRVTDRQVRESLAAVLRSARERGAPKVAVAVRSGHVTLTGELPTRRELARVEELVSRVHGVRSITSQIQFPQRRITPDHVIRARLQARLGAAFPGTDLSVSVFSGVAVVAGRVRRLATKHAAARMLREDDGVKRVLNAVQVV